MNGSRAEVLNGYIKKIENNHYSKGYFIKLFYLESRKHSYKRLKFYR